MREAKIQAETMRAIQEEWPTALVLRQNTGVSYDKSGRPIRFGTPGQGDIRAVIDGYACDVECKTPTGRQSTKQKNFQKAFERAGGIYVLARSAEDCINELREQINGRNARKGDSTP